MEKVTNPLELTPIDLILQEIEKESYCPRLADGVRIQDGVPEDAIYLGYLDTFYRKLLVSPQMKDLFLSMGVHLCLAQDEGEGNGMYLYVFMDKQRVLDLLHK